MRKPHRRRWTFRGNFNGDQEQQKRHYDRVFIPKSIKGRINECRKHRGTLKDSDHALVMATLRVGLCQRKPPQGPQRITRVLNCEETASEVSKARAAAVGETYIDWVDVEKNELGEGPLCAL